MACTTGNNSSGITLPGGFTLPGVGGFLTEWLPLILNVWLTYEMLEAQEEAEEAMEAIAETSLDASEDLFDKFMDMRDRDQEVYDFQNTQPLYKACNRDKHAIQASREATRFVNEAMMRTSRFDCGTKQKAVRAAQRAMILGTLSEQETMRQYELNVEDQYLESHYNAIVTAASGNQPNQVSQSFNNAAALWQIQNQSATTNAAGSVASVGYFGSAALTNLFG